MTEYIAKGINGASISVRFPLIAEALNIFINRISENAKAVRIAKFRPVPPLVFLQESDTPITVSIM